MATIEQQDLLDNLLDQFEEQRSEIKSMIADLERLREKIDLLLPEQLDARYMRFFEEKIKTLTSFFSILLEMRKEITKNLKEEIVLRRKFRDTDELGSIDEYLDIRDFASKVEDFRRKKDKRQKGRIEKSKSDMESVESLVTVRESG